MEFSFLFKNDEAARSASDLVWNDSCEFRLSRKYQIYYRYFRPIMPIAIRQLLQRSKKTKVAENWYEPTRFIRTMGDCLSGGERHSTIHPWPDAAAFAFVLTHDVETSVGMKHIPRIAKLEESLGFRSSWNLVPHKYKIDMGLVKDLKSRGFEIGVHGFNHDGNLYTSKNVFERRASEINKALEEYGAVGFRSPMVHRNLSWLQLLDVEYDSSCFDIDPFQAGPGGVGSIWPFIAGRFVELPYTLPQDHTLFVGLGQVDDSIWRKKLEFLIRYQAMALMLTHPDYMTGTKELDTYVNFLKYVKDRGDYWHALPMEVADWWREREQMVEFGLNATEDGDAAPTSGDRRFRAAELQPTRTGFEFVSKN